MSLWAIREEASYADAVEGLGISVKRLDEVLEGTTWAIARAADDDEQCPELLDNGLRYARATMPEAPDCLVRVWFLLDHENKMACLVSIDLTELSATATIDF